MRFCVPVPPCHVVLPLLLVLPTVALAQPGQLEPAPVVRQLELSQTPRPEAWVAPAQATEVVLDAKLDTEAMRRAAPVKGLRRMEVTESTVVLVPAAGLKEGDSLELPLWFAEGPPAQLVLRVDSARAEPRVEVYRGDIPPEALKRQVAALNTRMEALRAQPPSLIPLMAAGLLRPTGVRSQKLDQSSVIVTKDLTSSGGWFHVAQGRMGLEVSLTLAPGAAPWVPATARLKQSVRSGPLPVRSSLELLGGVALQPGNTTRLLVEWDTPPETEGLASWLQVNERHGARSLTVELRLLKPSPAVAPAQERKP